MDFAALLSDYNEAHPHTRVESMPCAEGGFLLVLSGDLEMKASSDIAPLLEAALLECPPRGRIVLDLAGVGYISSNGVGLLSTTMVKAEKLAKTLVLANIPPRVRVIMDTLGLLSFFTVEGSCD
jgi:anti-sigma B factor antagonist